MKSGLTGPAPHPFLLIEPGRHLRLSHLALHGEAYKGESHAQLLSFQNLRVLDIDGILLRTKIKPRATPTLPFLEKISISHQSNLTFLDDWLVACKRLRALEMRGIYISALPTKLLASGKIQELGLIYCSFAQPIGWLSSISLQTLEVSSDTLSVITSIFLHPPSFCRSGALLR